MVEAAHGLTAMLLDDPSSIQPRETVTFAVSGSEPDYLLLDWLNELLFHYDTTGWVGREFEVTLADDQLQAKLLELEDWSKASLTVPLADMLSSPGKMPGSTVDSPQVKAF